ARLRKCCRASATIRGKYRSQSLCAAKESPALSRSIQCVTDPADDMAQHLGVDSLEELHLTIAPFAEQMNWRRETHSLCRVCPGTLRYIQYGCGNARFLRRSLTPVQNRHVRGERTRPGPHPDSRWT